MTETIQNRKSKKVEDKTQPSLARAERLRRVRNMANLSRQAMCSAEDLNINTYKGWEIGRYGGLTREGAEKIIARVLDEGLVCSLAWLLDGEGALPYVLPFNRVRENIVSSEKEAVLSELRLFQMHYQDAIFIEITDDAMLPYYSQGDFVAGRILKGEEIKNTLDKKCIIKIKQGETLVRYLRKAPKKNHFYLVPLNPETSRPVTYEIEVEFAAPIVRHYST